MCKLFAVAGINKKNRGAVEKLVDAVTPIMSKTPDNDGFGFAAITKKGEVYGEKWLYNNDAWKVKENPEPSDGIKYLSKNMGSVLEDMEVDQEEIYRHFGGATEGDPTAYILHSRKVTVGEQTIENTHPFYHCDTTKAVPPTALIHNGTISNHQSLTKIHSTCDSETILHEYLSLAVNYEAKNMDTLSNRLDGEYAVALLTSVFDENTNKMRPIMDVFKSNKNLFCGYVTEIGVVFATTKEILETGCKSAGLTLEGCYPLRDGFLLRFDAVSGELIGDMETFTASAKYDGPYSQHEGATEYKIIGKDVKMKESFGKDFLDKLKDPYYTIADLSTEEKDYLDKVKKEGGERSKALALVQHAMSRA